MVDATKIKSKLPNLLVDGCTSNPVNWQQLLKKEYRLQKYQERKPDNFNADLNNVIAGLERLNKNTESAFQEFKFTRKR